MKGKLYVTISRFPYQPLLTSSTFLYRRWISQIGCSTFLTQNIRAVLDI